MRLDRQFLEKDSAVRGGLQCALYWFAETAKTLLRDGCFDYDFCMEKAEEGMTFYYPRSVNNGWGSGVFPYSKEEWQRVWEMEKEDFECVARQYVQERKTECMISQIRGATAVPKLNDVLDSLGMPYRVLQMQSGVKIFVEVGKKGENVVLSMKYGDITDGNLSRLRDCVVSLKDMTGLFQIPICVRKLTVRERTAFNSGLVQ